MQTGVPRSSPIVEPLVPPKHQIHKSSSPNKNGAFAGQPGGILDLSGIQKVTGTNRAGMFVSTAVHGEGSHHQFLSSSSPSSHGMMINDNNNYNNENSNSSPSSHRRKQHGGFDKNPYEESARKRREKYEMQQQLLSERSPVVSTAVYIRDDSELQQRFAASILPGGQRSVQPLPDFLDSSFGFQATVDTKPPTRREEDTLPSLASGDHDNSNHSYLSTTSSNHQYEMNTSNNMNNNNNNIASPSPIPKSNSTPIHHHQRSATSHSHHRSSRNNNNNKAEPQQQSLSTSKSTRRPLSSSKYLFSPRTQQQQQSSRSRGGGGVRTSSANQNTNTTGRRSHHHNNTLGGKANKVLCCPEEHAVTGHLAKGIVIGTCERQAMEQYLQVSRELELEKEARATDKWKAELELVKALNKSQDLEKQVEKLTEIAENPRPLHDAKLLRQEFETRWRAAQARVDELENEKKRDGAVEEELRLKLMQKEHECEGLKAAVKRMESTDNNHEQELADWRKKWFVEKAEKEKQMGIVVDLEKQVSRISYENKSLRGAIRGLEQRLILSARKDKAHSSNKNNNNNNSFAAGSPANAVGHLSTGNNSGVQLNDLDAAVRVLMHAYSSPGQSPLKMRPTLSATNSPRRSGVVVGSSSSRKSSPAIGQGVLNYMSNKKNDAQQQKLSSARKKNNALDNVMVKTTESEMHNNNNTNISGTVSPTPSRQL